MHHHPRRLIALPTTLLACLSCSGPDEGIEPSPPWPHRQAIVNGTVDKGHPAVGILHSGGSSACTATLIGKRTLLTAAHCVLTKSAPHTILSPVQFYVGGFNGTLYPGASAAAHPNYQGGNQSDIAVVRLTKDVVGVAPMPIASTRPYVGEKIVLVGYGKESAAAGTFGVKRQGPSGISQVSSTVFTFSGGIGSEAMVCQGDSGGPTLATLGGRETVIGVHSTSAKGCMSFGTDTRVDAYQQWIKQQLSKGVYGAPCAKHGDCLSRLCLASATSKFCSQECVSKPCPYGDKCAGVGGGSIAKACLPNSGVGPKSLGDPCSNALDCGSQICVPIPSKGSFCSEQCDPKKSGCPRGFNCIPTANGGGVCITGGSKKLGEKCGDSFDCATQICVQVPGQGNLCARRCQVKNNPCPGGYDCAPTTSGGGLCVPKGSTPNPLPPPPPPRVKKPPGEPCVGPEDCVSGLCAPASNVNVCLRWCDRARADCPMGFHCTPVKGKTRGACVETIPQKGDLGATCAKHGDCKSKICAAAGTERFCTALCDPSQGCASGYDCAQTGDKHVCVPTTAASPPPVEPPADEGGCAIAGRPRWPPWTLLALMLLVGHRRRSARRVAAQATSMSASAQGLTALSPSFFCSYLSCCSWRSKTPSRRPPGQRR